MSQAPSFPFRVEFPQELPITARAEEITEAIQRHPVVILAGETGSGKSTQIPKMCLAAGRGTAGRIACTQPRRVAALSVSRRVAEELGVAWGREVGCKVRFSDETTRATRIKFLTDGMLLSEAQGDPLLREYDTIIVDEAHERSLNIDFLLGHLRQLSGRRPDLKIIITSATIDTAEFSAAFGNAPVIKVEGRTFPVEVIYAPLDSFGPESDPESSEAAEKAETLHYIDGAVEAVDRILKDSSSGDILVFMPSERDVRDTRDLIEGRCGKSCELVPLFGRLTNAEQQRVFAQSQRRKIVVATNIAETSLTIPGIRYVVDTGLARISRYVPQARTRRLPIEEISQSSADQRRGRCGRVSDGVCIRLFSEADYLSRPRFTQPEIHRANLADVILRLKAFAFGEAEDFPFLNPPPPKAVRAGYALLEELGALESDGTLSEIGRDLARLPVDPTVGRMILQARTERALSEVLVIAAGLSVQDPRERPLDKQDQADAMHRRFAHPESDFLVLLRIWEAYHGEFEQMTQAKLRRFCREHFLSYTRMREWRDVHSQLEDVLKDRRDFRMTSIHDGRRSNTEEDAKMLFISPGYRAIHRSILTGLLGNLATWDEANPGFKATHDRRVSIFPGSMLFKRAGASKGSAKHAAPDKGKVPVRWLMAAEIMETTKLYARTCARIDPEWAASLGSHVTRVAHSEPFWDEKAGRVKVKQRTRLYGLEIDSRAVSYGKINPAEATDIFIREGLVNDTVTWPFDFLIKNRELREDVVERLARARHGGSLNLEEMTYRFYVSRLSLSEIGPEGVSAVSDLVILVRERRAKEPRFLMMEETDLFDPSEAQVDEASFPASVPIQNTALPLQYAFRPGKEDDGVTLDVSFAEARKLSPAALDWAVPGHLAEKVEHYLRALPKELRRTFVPLAESAARLATIVASRHRLTAGRETVADALAAELRERHRMGLTASIWEAKPLPDHLRVRVRVLDAKGSEIVLSRDWTEIAAAVAAAEHLEKAGAEAAVRQRTAKCLEAELKYEFAWLERDLRKIRELGPLAATLASPEVLQVDAHHMLKDWALARERVESPESPDAIKSAADSTKVALRKAIPRFLDVLREVLDLRSQLLVARDPYPGLQNEVDALVGTHFLRDTPLDRFWHLPRYLQAMKVRADRWKKNPAKDAERAKAIAPFSKAPPAVRWLVEEFRVSLFAQELGTSEPVSAVKLNQAIGSLPGNAPAKADKAPPAVIRLDAPETKSKPLKSLNALDKIFTR
ncbi:MAG TPA: ATP-dependent RNA helicase HrpA [Opitutaceae bacterium]